MLRRVGLVVVLAALLGAGIVATHAAAADGAATRQLAPVHGVVPATPGVRPEATDRLTGARALAGLALLLAALAVVAPRLASRRPRTERTAPGRRLARAGAPSRAPPVAVIA